MGARSLRIDQEKLQRARVVQYCEGSSPVSSPPLPTNSFANYPPIFRSPSNLLDPFSPSPSPLPAFPGSHHTQVPTAVIVGSSIAGVVALAATATIVYTVAAKVGLTCLFGPIFRLFSCLSGNLLGAACAERLKSLCNNLNNCNPMRKQQRSNSAADDIEGSADGNEEIVGGSPTTRTSKVESTVAAAQSLTTSPLRNVVKGQVEQLQNSAHAYLVTTASDSAEPESKKTKEMMMQPLHQNITKAQSYAESLLSVADNVSDDVGRLEGNKANYVEASTERIAAMWRNPGDTTLSMFNEAIGVGVDKTTKSQKLTSEKLQAPVLLEEEAVLHRKRGKPPLPSSNVGANEVEQEKLKQRVISNNGGEKSEQVYIVESASDAHTELQVLEQTAAAPASDTQEISEAASSITHSMALVAADTGDMVMNSPALGTMVSIPTKALAPVQVGSKEMTSTSTQNRARDDVTTLSKDKQKRPSNLGHVSLSCEMSSHRLRFFTSCRFGGTYGSPPASPD